MEYEYERTTIPALWAGWRQIAAATPVTYNNIRNVAALTQRHPAPARGLHRGKYNLCG